MLIRFVLVRKVKNELKISNDTKRPSEIWVGDMKLGDIGQIISWNENLLYRKNVGIWIRATKNDLVQLDKPHMWPNKLSLPNTCRVRLMEPGEELTIKCVS